MSTSFSSTLGIEALFLKGSTTRRDEPGPLSTDRVNDDQHAGDAGEPNRDEARDLRRVDVHEVVDVLEYGDGLNERHAVLSLICGGLPVVPLEVAILDGGHA